MTTKKKLVALVLLAIVLAGCSGSNVVDPRGDPNSEIPPTVQPTTEAPIYEQYTGGYGTDDPHEIYGGENPTISVSGGHVITGKTEIWTYPDGWSRLVKAENGAGTSWSNMFMISQADEGLTHYWPEPWALMVEGSGVFEITLKPDNTEGGYNSSDLNGLGLAFWINGHNATVQVSHDGGATWLAPSPYELTSGKAGIDFPLDGGAVTIRLVLTDGIVTLPLGESVPTGDLPLWQ